MSRHETTTATTTTLEPFVNSKAVAKHLGVSLRHVQRLTQDGVLPFYTLGERSIRYKLSDVDEHMTRLRVNSNRDSQTDTGSTNTNDREETGA